MSKQAQEKLVSEADVKSVAKDPKIEEAKRRVLEKQGGTDSKSAIKEIKRKLIAKKELEKMEEPGENPIKRKENIELIQSQIQSGNQEM